MSYKIVVDASCDVDINYIENKSLYVLPMSYSLDEGFKVCDGIQNKEDLSLFYNNQRKGNLTKTTQITPFLYEQYFNELLQDCDSLLYLSLSSGLSNTYSSALIAANNITKNNPNKNIKVFDSLGATVGIGLLAKKAILNRENGLSIEDNYEDLLNLRNKVRYYFMVDDLMYLQKGGRISSTTAMLGTAIGIKPILIINSEGKLETIEKKKGSNAALNYIFEHFLNNYDTNSLENIHIVDSDNERFSNNLSQKVLESVNDKEITHLGLSPIIGAHTGPGLVGLVYVGK